MNEETAKTAARAAAAVSENAHLVTAAAAILFAVVMLYPAKRKASR